MLRKVQKKAKVEKQLIIALKRNNYG
jgi:hypothetical protein